MAELATEHRDHRAGLRTVITAFVSLIEDEPELYRFAYAQTGRSGRADLVAATEHQIADALAALFAEQLEAAGRPTAAATTWAYGVVGMVQLTTHWWSMARPVSAAELVEQLVALADGGLTALLPPADGEA
jgi:AcrR family transcriptional regulator